MTTIGGGLGNYMVYGMYRKTASATHRGSASLAGHIE